MRIVVLYLSMISVGPNNVDGAKANIGLANIHFTITNELNSI